MHQRLRFLIQALAALAACAAPAFAVERDIERTLAIVELRAGTEQNSLTVDYLRDVIAAFKAENTGDYILVPADKIAEKLGRDRDQVPGAVTDERRKTLAEAKQKGIAYLDNADASNAIKALQAAESKYRATLAAPGADDGLRKEYLDVLAQLATAYVVARDKDAASEVFRGVVTTFGLKANITDDNYRPDVVELFKSVIKDVNQLQKGSVEVSAASPGSRIILGGNDRGATPTTIPDLIPGVYTLRLQQGNSTSMLHRVKVSGGKTTKIAIDLAFESHLVLEDHHVGLSYADLEAAKGRVLVDAAVLGRDLGVNMVCVVGVIDQNLVSFVIDVGQNHIERSDVIKVPGVGTSKRAVARVLTTIVGEKTPEGTLPPPVEHKPVARPWYKNYPAVAVAGGAVIALAVGLAYSGSLSGADQVVKTQAEKDTIESDRKIAGVGLGLGGALGITAAVLFVLGNGNASADAGTHAAHTTQDMALPPPLGLGAVTFATR